MKKFMFSFLLIIVFIAGCSGPNISKQIKKVEVGIDASNEIFTESYAISRVIKEHPEFPDTQGKIKIEMPIGGSAGAKVTAYLETDVKKAGAKAYIVTFSKTIYIKKYDGSNIVLYWKYKITPNETVLLDSKADDPFLRAIK